MTVTLKEIETVICERFRISHWDLHNPTRARRVSIPRQAFFYRARDLTPHTLPAIARWFGFHHTSVICGIRSTERRLARRKGVYRLVEEAGLQLAAPPPDPAAMCACGRGKKSGPSNECTLCHREKSLASQKAAAEAAQKEKYWRRRRLIAFAQAHASTGPRP
jgi:hypothetical protein